MVSFRLPVKDNGDVVGAFSYATGSNVGDGRPGGTNHIADISSSILDPQSLRITVPHTTLNPGDLIDFQFEDADANFIKVIGATITRSDGPSTTKEQQLEGLLTATGLDQNGNEVALLVSFYDGAKINAGDVWYDHDQNSSEVVALDPPVKMIYIGNHPDADIDESDYLADSRVIVSFGEATAGDGVLAVVKLQPVNASGSKRDYAIDENDRGDSGGDYWIYTNPETNAHHEATQDTSALINADVTYVGESGELVTENMRVILVQMVNGDVFITELSDNGMLDGKQIQSIKITGVVTTNSGFVNDSWSADVTIVCFTAAVPILTPFGYIAAYKLQVGDFVTTADHGAQQLRWVGKQHIDSIDFTRNPKLRPIRIRKGALGAGLPTKDILVSRQHRMLVQSKIARNMFGADEVLVPAIKLTTWPGVEIAEDVSEVTYIHLLFDQHEIVFAAGAPSESLFTGPEAMKAVSNEMRQEIFTLLPELESAGQTFQPARELLSNKMAKSLIAQHTKKSRPLIEG